jgi:transposase InsO family protein
MDIEGLIPVSWRRSVRTTVSDPKASPFPNLLKQDFRVALPNQTWVSDFTYVPTVLVQYIGNRKRRGIEKQRAK